MPGDEYDLTVFARALGIELEGGDPERTQAVVSEIFRSGAAVTTGYLSS
jgi:hypothetical protein